MSNSPLALLVAALFASGGEVVTRESGEPICTINAELNEEMIVAAPDDWCKDWKIKTPAIGEPIPADPPGQQWVRRGAKGGLQLHINGEWKP